MDSTPPGLDREAVASEPRRWVRIARACNNRCAFCLDSDANDGALLPRDEVERDMDEGRAVGATRLILSGGEATIHPDFTHFIRYGKAAGYTHVQTITNGRMFAYPRFAREVLDAGLDEVTFSLHGDTAELHDGLTGVGGSFAQTLKGIRNVVGSGRCIVSGDVVINGRNVARLRDILELFISLGVLEFDLLMVVPFGRAADEGSDMLFDAEAALPHLRRALELSEDPSLHIWTNRLPPPLLEGFELLIQDPHKLHDEVRGRADLWDDVLAGRPMRCAGDRCDHCFIQPLCEALNHAVQTLADGVSGVLLMDLRGPLPAPGPTWLDQPRDVLWIRGRDAADLARIPTGMSPRRVWLELDELDGYRGALDAAGLPQPHRIAAHDPRALDGALRASPPEVLVALNRTTAPLLAGLTPPTTSLIVAYRPSLTLKAAAQRDVCPDPTQLPAAVSRYVDIPPCLHGGSAPSEHEDPFPLAAVAGDGHLDLLTFVDHYIQRLYRIRSQRCRTCSHHKTCKGIAIHQARRFGLGILQPVRD